MDKRSEGKQAIFEEKLTKVSGGAQQTDDREEEQKYPSPMIDNGKEPKRAQRSENCSNFL